MEELEIRILPMSKKEFYSYTIPNQVATIEEIQKNFFIKSLKENKEKVYKFKKVYLKTTKNSLVLFQYDNQLIASALYKGVNIFKEDSEDFKNGYFGSYIFDKDSIKIFSPISNKEFQEIKEVKFSQAMHKIDYSKIEKIESLINLKEKELSKLIENNPLLATTDKKNKDFKLIEKIIFNKFRCAENLELKVGENLTILAGQNGTMKSTLLACIAQPFGIERGKGNDGFDSKILDKCKIVNNSFKTQINAIFKLSTEFDLPGEHDFDIYFSKDLPTNIFYENPLKVKSYKAEKRNPPIRIVTGKKRDAGKGNIPIPVIYLGLSRLFPLGESNLKKKDIILTDEEEKFLYENYRKILLSYEEEYKNINQISKNNIKTLGISTNNYDWQAISAGQDNVGKIICTILEFQRLKENFKDNYIGGILLIDEIESTLYPKAQQELIKFLNKQCQSLKLKVICTTHSLEIIKECIENEKLRYHTIINFLDKTHGKLTCKNLSTFEDISRNLLVLPKNNEKENLLKIKIFTEDSEGEWLLKKIINKDFEEYIDIVPLGLGFDEIAKVAYKLSEIKEGIVIYDADVKKRYAQSGNSSDFKRNMDKNKNYLFFPGENSIEEDFLEILRNTPESKNEFWTKCNNDTKQLALSTLEEFKLEDRNDRKKWFNNERKNYGKDGYVILEEWKKIYKKSINNFNEELKELLKNFFLRKYGIKLFNKK
ncbi:AAA family ATPase [Fusobacterium hwasookii]|uniref:ATPase AAA-type core domain-containing protein n=1 Tax=Fusobacterium hwasookii ChDC F128 TaxID=1216362 RepID=A0ABP2R7B5_9FUSO|nr:AAA family ATPase [Fusobacterium hwasookii]EJU08059.1 hypothetical protein B437_05450 [Fusobacterium hwasookii ChDC F128]